jgi:cytochrome b involved in lipid metabolism
MFLYFDVDGEYRKVDCTSVIDKHPGGGDLLRAYENRDATEVFASHSEHAWNWLRSLPYTVDVKL